LTLPNQTHASEIRAALPQDCGGIRNKVLSWTLSVINQIDFSTNTKELIIFLVDAEFARLNFQIIERETVVMACIMLVIKLQGDFCAGVQNLIPFIQDRLGLQMSDVWRYESILLANSPTYLGAMPGIMDLMKATLTINKIRGVTHDDLLELWNTVIESYITDITGIPSLQSMIVQSLIMSCCPESLRVFKLQSQKLDSQSAELTHKSNLLPLAPQSRSRPSGQC
jgi:hypothetical protein